MATAERVLWETITVVAFLLLLAGTVFWSGSRVERHRERLEADFAAKTAASAEEQRRAAAELETTFDRRTRDHRVAEGKAVASAFEAGVRSAVASRWRNYVNRAKDNLLRNPRVTFLHILTPRGGVLSSSDPELARTGRIDERGDWARSATEISVRDGAQADSIELAVPVNDNDTPVAFLWLGYDLEGASSGAAAEAATSD